MSKKRNDKNDTIEVTNKIEKVEVETINQTNKLDDKDIKIKQYAERNKMLFIMLIGMVSLNIWNTLFPMKINNNVDNNQKISNKIINSDAKESDINQISDLTNVDKIEEIILENDKIKMIINKNDAKLIFLELKQFHADEKKKKINQNIVLIDEKNYASFGWIVNKKYHIPKIWKLLKHTFNQISIEGVNDLNQIFIIDFIIEDDYLLKINNTIINNSKENIIINNYGKILKQEKDDAKNYSYDGILSLSDNTIEEIEYKNIKKKNIEKVSNKESKWLAFSDQYWLTALIPYKNNNNNSLNVTNVFDFQYSKDKKVFQLSYLSEDIIVKNNDKFTSETLLYVGPKDLDILSNYETKYKIKFFDKAIDFGMFYFISKPLLQLIKKLYDFTGNFGVAIILLTFIVRILMTPLANKSYRSIAKMQKVAPKIKVLQESYKNDKIALQSALMDMYKKENINPFASIIPLLLQIPVFFALYKVLSISIEMRDTPFILWIKDLSERDPTSIFNLFGLLNFQVPEYLQIGILPILMGFTMFLQQKMSHTSDQITDETQKSIMQYMPIMFTVMFAHFPSGLILYWTVSNFFALAQQWYVNRK